MIKTTDEIEAPRAGVMGRDDQMPKGVNGARLGTRYAAEPHSHAATLAGRRKDGLRQNDSLRAAKGRALPEKRSSDRPRPR
jgi:hypothetical protein